MKPEDIARVQEAVAVLTAARKVPHVPWIPQETKLIQDVDENAWVYNVPVGQDKTRNVQFWRMKWPFGGYVTTATCECNESYEAGGLAGENALKLWAERHACKQVVEFESDEDKRLFRH